MWNNFFTFQMLVRLPQNLWKVWHDVSQPAVEKKETKQKQTSQNVPYSNREKMGVKTTSDSTICQ